MDQGWWAVLEGDPSYLDDLVKHFDRPELRVVKEGGSFYLGSSRFAELDQPRAVYDEAVRLVSIAVGGAMLELGRFETPRVTRLYRVEKDGSQRPYGAPITSTLRLCVPIHGGEERTLPDGSVVTVAYVPAPRLADYAELAIRNVEIEDALALLGREDVGWRELYVVYEIVEAAVGGRIWRDGWAPKRDVERFTQTACSRESLGRDARHGHSRTPARPDAPSLDEARHLVRRIVAAWLEATLPERGRIYIEE